LLTRYPREAGAILLLLSPDPASDNGPVPQERSESKNLLLDILRQGWAATNPKQNKPATQPFPSFCVYPDERQAASYRVARTQLGLPLEIRGCRSDLV
jgi:hypothetical protein